MKLEMIDWTDHMGTGGSLEFLDDLVDDMKPRCVTTVGWVAKETDKYIVVVSTKSDNDDAASNASCILKSTIIRRRNVK